MASNMEGASVAKVKVCGWRVCTDTLPSRANLTKKGVLLVDSCPNCDAPQETAHHILRDCSFSRAVWFAEPLGLGAVVNSNEPIKEWLFRVLEEEMVDYDAVLMFLWSLWKEWNCVVWEGNLSEVQNHWI